MHCSFEVGFILSAEKDLSIVPFVAGITNKMENTFTASESKERLSPRLIIHSLRVQMVTFSLPILLK